MKVILSVIIAGIFSATCQSAVVIDNLFSTSNGFSTGLTGPVGRGFLGPPRDSQTAFSFTTGSDADALVSLETYISVTDNNSPILATLSTGPNVPGGTNPISLGSVTPAATSGFTVITHTPASPIALAANTTYWIHYTVPSSNAWYGVLHADAPTTQLGYTLGTSWQSTFNTAWSDITPQARIRLTTVNPVPEPSSALIGSLGILLFVRRRVR
jgi:hypothetical protein